MADEFDNLKEIEAYVKKHEIHILLKDSVVQLCSVQPENPLRFLRDYFDKLDNVKVSFISTSLRLWKLNTTSALLSILLKVIIRQSHLHCKKHKLN